MASNRSSMRRSGADRRREALRNLLLVVVTDRKRCRGDLLESCEAAVRGGATAVLLRDRDLPRPERRRLAKGLRTATAKYGASLLVHTDVALAREVGADGVHFSAEDGARRVPGLLVGVSCHSEEEVRRAAAAGADYAFLGPVESTRSHPGALPLGWPAFVAASSRSPVPLVAIGGVTPKRLQTAGFPPLCPTRRVAAIGAILAAPDPSAAAGSLLGAIPEVPAIVARPKAPDADERSVVAAFLGRIRISPDLALGPGDDAVVLRGSGVAAAVDLTVEGVHYEQGTPARDVGFKAAGRALSDLAAVGAAPVGLMVGMAVPRGPSSAGRAQGIEAGACKAARAVGTRILGGDTKETGGTETVSVTALGRVDGPPALPRSGGRPGDVLFLSGPIGGAFLGRHLRPRPRIAVGLALRRRRLATACIDVSDGLASDLHRLCRASGTGAVLRPSRSLLHSDARPFGVEHALRAGEDYELLFAVPPEKAEAVEARGAGGRKMIRIGRLVHASAGVLVQEDRELRPLPDEGWVHLRAR